MPTTTTEKPILFSTEMIQAILDGRKTQTRRVIKNAPDVILDIQGRSALGGYEPGEESQMLEEIYEIKCPYRADELWVRETFKPVSYNEHGWIIKYKADSGTKEVERLFPAEYKEKEMRWAAKACQQFQEYDKIPWRPSIHMPRLASRIQLTVDDIRVERVQEITTEDAIAEGIPVTAGEAVEAGMFDTSERPGHEWDNKKSIEHFADLWDSINADRGYPWESNPYVWVIKFEVKNIKE